MYLEVIVQVLLKQYFIHRPTFHFAQCYALNILISSLPQSNYLHTVNGGFLYSFISLATYISPAINSRFSAESSKTQSYLPSRHHFNYYNPVFCSTLQNLNQNRFHSRLLQYEIKIQLTFYEPLCLLSLFIKP